MKFENLSLKNVSAGILGTFRG